MHQRRNTKQECPTIMMTFDTLFSHASRHTRVTTLVSLNHIITAPQPEPAAFGDRIWVVKK